MYSVPASLITVNGLQNKYVRNIILVYAKKAWQTKYLRFFLGRRLIERSKTFAANLEDLHSIWTRKSRTASSQRSSINQDHPATSTNKDLETNDMAIRTVDSNGVLQLPQIVSQAPPVLDVRPPSPPKRTIVDGVTDVIRIQITGSAKH